MNGDSPTGGLSILWWKIFMISLCKAGDDNFTDFSLPFMLSGNPYKARGLSQQPVPTAVSTLLGRNIGG